MQLNKVPNLESLQSSCRYNWTQELAKWKLEYVVCMDSQLLEVNSFARIGFKDPNQK